MTPLYNYTEQSPYVVQNYPYGFKLKTTISFWLESNSKNGFRFCSQTVNPKNNRLNAPKKSTYCLLAGCLFLDDEQHTVWSGLTEYSSAEQVLEFINKFPQSDLNKIFKWCNDKKTFGNMQLQGEAYFKINNKKLTLSDYEKEKIKEENAVWEQCIEALNVIQKN